MEKTNESGEAAQAKRIEVGQYRSSKADGNQMLSDLTGFDHLRAMLEGEATFKTRKNKRRRRRNINKMKKKNGFNDAEQPFPVSGSNSKAEEEYEILSDLTGFDNLRAMLEGEATVETWKKTRNKKKMNNGFDQHPFPVDNGKPAIDTEQVGRDESEGDDERTVEVSKCDLFEISDNAVGTAVKENKMIETVEAGKSRNEGISDEDSPKEEVVNICSSSSVDDGLISNISSRKSTGKRVSMEATVNEDRKKRMRRKELETGDAGKKEIFAKKPKCIGTVKSQEKSAQNTVLRKLLRKPRYFDPPNGCWNCCPNCGEDHPPAANCSLQKRVKPCFLCGSLQHVGNHCSQGQSLFVYRRGNQANVCLEKQEEDKIYIICLRCGDSGHDMFSCRSDYSPVNLKEIRCYICNDFGHLSCVKLPDMSSIEVSCYNCSQSGHLGSECPRCPNFTRDSKSPAFCYRCREEGHLARTCSLSRKRARRVRAKMRRSLGSSCAPPNCGPQNDIKDANGKIQEILIIN